MEPTIGVVIRTLNEAALIGRCLETLEGQQPKVALDVLVVDSGSTDATIDIARRKGARVHHIAPEDFDYSKALNVGIEHVDGDLVLILSAHAIPTDEHWVARMTAPFEDPAVAGVSCRQVPWENAPWREAARLAREFSAESHVYRGDPAGVVFSNAASCIRRSVWKEAPFTLPASEDFDWAQRVIAAGSAIAYDGEASVYHSHDETPREQARRLVDINRAHDDDRSRRRAVREAAIYLRRDTKAIIRLDEPMRRKIGHMRELVAMVGFYVFDWSRTGSTAERRREDAAS